MSLRQVGSHSVSTVLQNGTCPSRRTGPSGRVGRTGHQMLLDRLSKEYRPRTLSSWPASEPPDARTTNAAGLKQAPVPRGPSPGTKPDLHTYLTQQRRPQCCFPALTATAAKGAVKRGGAVSRSSGPGFLGSPRCAFGVLPLLSPWDPAA